ncbi:MAG: hypothetical protein IKC65_03900 [Lentisphaeria bacterium]|nr:hypothetical protein [Lentisphaeria bacterium]
MTKAETIAQKAAELMKDGSVVITAADIKNGVVQKIQVYFWDDKSAVMDIISKDDLVQNFPDEGVYVLVPGVSDAGKALRQLEMFEGEEDMYFRTDGTKQEEDEFAGVPPVLFMETVEAVCGL